MGYVVSGMLIVRVEKAVDATRVAKKKLERNELYNLIFFPR
jgi:hypothetical protein